MHICERSRDCSRFLGHVVHLEHIEPRRVVHANHEARQLADRHDHRRCLLRVRRRDRRAERHLGEVSHGQSRPVTIVTEVGTNGEQR